VENEAEKVKEEGCLAVVRVGHGWRLRLLAAAATRGREQRVGEGESGARVFQRIGLVPVLIPRG
jgi:hypothetical protein